MATLASIGGRPVWLRFERACGADGCELPELADIDTDADADADADAGADAPVMVVDAGAAIALGKRAAQEDHYVLTSFDTTTSAPSANISENSPMNSPRRHVLAAVFDGHRGARAAAHAAATLPRQVEAALARAEPSALAAAWRCVAAEYAELGTQVRISIGRRYTPHQPVHASCAADASHLGRWASTWGR